MAANTGHPQGVPLQPQSAAGPAGVQQMSRRPALQQAHSEGSLAGFGNMLGKELDDWFQTKRWLIQMFAWLVIINGFIAFVLWIVPVLEEAARSQGQTMGNIPAPMLMGLTLFFSFVVQIGTIGVVILAHDEMVGEKQTGTAAWVLSKPVSRTSFVLSKLVAGVVGTFLFILALPALVAFGEIWFAAGTPADVPRYLLGIGVAALALLFYLTLTLMLGVLFNQRGPVLGIAFGVLFGIMFMSGFVPDLVYVLPVGLEQKALALANGSALPATAIYTLSATAAWTIVFTIVALWRFQRQEL